MSGTDEQSEHDPVGDRSEPRVSPLQFAAVAGGAGLVGSYTVPWVEVTGEQPGSISARELELLPELAVAIGALAVVITVLRWTTRAQVAVLVFGLAGTGLGLFVWFFLDSDADVIRVGEQAGPPASFEPGLGLLIAFAGSVVLVAAGFLALLREL